MRVLLLNQFYPPDVAPTGRYLHDLACALVARGHEVHVLCSRWPYETGPAIADEHSRDGVSVHRLGGLRTGRGLFARALGAAIFMWSAGLRALLRLPRPDVVLALTTPPYLGSLAAVAARRHRAAHVHWVMDVYPDVLAAHGLIASQGLAMSLLRALARVPWRSAAALVALGPTMRAALERTSGSGRVLALPLWAPHAPLREPAPFDPAARQARGWDSQELVLLYSGNLGRGHLVADFLEAARALGPGGPRWVFAGGGSRREELLRFAQAHPAARLECRPYVPQAQIAEQQAAADVHLISLAAAFRGLMVPSKLQAAFALGRPVLFVGPVDCETAAWIRESGGGWVIGEGDLPGLLQAVASAGDAQERQRRGAAALAFARERFDPAQGCARLVECLERAATPAYTGAR